VGEFQYFADPRPLTADMGLAPQPNPLLSSGPNPDGSGQEGGSLIDAAVDKLTGDG
jgi:hypothetical protein